MRSGPIEKLRGEGERTTWHQQYIRNALATIGQISTDDKDLADYLLKAEQALRKADAYIKVNRL